MVQTAESSQASSTGGEADREVKKHLNPEERERLIYRLAEDDYAEQLVDIPRYFLSDNAEEKLEHNEGVVNEALNNLYQTSLATLSPKEKSLTLIQLNKAGVDLNVCPNYSIEASKPVNGKIGLRTLEKRCSSPLTYKSGREYSDCDVQLKKGPCLLLERLADEEDKSWEQIVEELNRKNEQIRESYQEPTIIDR